MPDNLRFAILGCGYMGRGAAKRLAALPGVSVTAICDRNLEAARAVAADGGASVQAFDRFDDLLDRAPVDAVVIALPPFAHDGQLEAAAARGIHVFVEKPIALTVARGESMVAAAERAGIHTQVGYHLRFLPALQRLRRMLDDGSAGRPTLFQGRYQCNSLHGPWWRDAAKSGGQILEQAIHVYDLALWFLGAPASASGFAMNLQHRQVPGYTAEDTSAAVLRFSSGALAGICATNASVPGEWKASFTLVCERLTVTWSQGAPTEFVHVDGEASSRELMADENDPYVEELRHFAAVLRGEAAPVAPIREGLAGLRAACAVLTSSASGGTPVDLTS